MFPVSELKINQLLFLTIGILLAGFPHWERLPFWIPALHLALLIFRILFPFKYPGYWRKSQRLIGFARVVIMVLGVLGVYLSYGTLAGRDVGIALLVMLAGLKIFETNNQRDFYISAFLGYFLVVTNFFYSQTIPTAIYMLFVIVIMTTGLIKYNDPDDGMSLKEQTIYSSKMILQSLPLLLVLFILFPRVNGPLWGLPEDAYTGITGIDDQMTPGTISKLVQSNEVAFRVSFNGPIPEQSKLYWRGPVLWQTDGRKWTVGKRNSSRTPEPVRFSGSVFQYDVTIEPTNKRWLFGLEMVSGPPERTSFTFDRQLKSDEAIQSRKIFTLVSNTSYILDSHNPEDLKHGLQLPDNYYPRTRMFADELINQYEEPEELINAVLSWFNQESFVYTLNPPLITGDMVDEFLFNTRQGFCEHYAAAFTVLMRAAGIPARVVTGYQGGEINPFGEYMIVRQHHAHAWVEVWLENKGWVRFDPTSAVSPDRVNQSIENSIPEAIIDVPLNLQNSELALRIWRRMSNTFDMINYQWAQWVLGYNPDRQFLFLSKFGLGLIDWKRLALLMGAILIVILIITGIFIFRNRIKTKDLAKRYYDMFCLKLNKINIRKESNEGPREFADRVINERKDLYVDVDRITELYIAVRYRSLSEKMEDLKLAIKRFSPVKSYKHESSTWK